MALSRTSRACMVCGMVQTMKQFLQIGCPNCESILQLRNSTDAVQECTSQLFEGVITLGDPTGSWVAKWLRLTEYMPGVYAIKVNGTLPREVVETLEDNGIKYVPRDGSEADDDRSA